MKMLSLDMDGKIQKGFVQRMKGELWIHFQGRTYCYKPKKNFSSETGSSKLDFSQIKAPMPGKIIKINNAKGSQAKQGDVLVVMEAMKMEYTLKAGKDCSIDEILCQEGEQVELGQTLMKLEVIDG